MPIYIIKLIADCKSLLTFKYQPMLPLQLPHFFRSSSDGLFFGGGRNGNENSIKTPFYFVKKRLRQNKPAMFGLLIIAGSLVATLLGYSIMPDATPYANDSAVEIQKQPPVFQVRLLKLRKNAEIPQLNFFQRLLSGQESVYTLVPIDAYRMDHLTVWVKRRGLSAEEPYDVIDATLPLFIGDSKKLGTSRHYQIEGNRIRFLDENEDLREISQEALIRTFKANNLETRHYWLGTDKAGRDMLSRLLFGIRISLGVGFLAVVISLIVGVGMGAVAGFFGGRTDRFVMWIMTVVWSIPAIMLVIAISLALQSRGVWVAFVAVGLTMWVDIARVVRGQIMGLKEKLYIEAARSMGISNRRIIVRHILPNMLGPLIVIISSNFATAILTEAGLSFLGLGVQPPMPSWGMMVNEGFQALGSRGSLHLVLLPSLCISLLVLAFNLLGNGLRDAFDPGTMLK
jgi:ABC-type dipeptide/oligopeptide/nickel transport system permease subunit